MSKFDIDLWMNISYGDLAVNISTCELNFLCFLKIWSDEQYVVPENWILKFDNVVWLSRSVLELQLVDDYEQQCMQLCKRPPIIKIIISYIAPLKNKMLTKEKYKLILAKGFQEPWTYFYEEILSDGRQICEDTHEGNAKCTSRKNLFI